MTNRFLDLFDHQRTRELTQVELAPLGIQLLPIFHPDCEQVVQRCEGVRQYPEQAVFFLRDLQNYCVSFACAPTESQTQSLAQIDGIRHPGPYWSIETPAALAAFVHQLDRLYGPAFTELDLSAQGRRRIDDSMSAWRNTPRDDLASLTIPTFAGIWTARTLHFGVLLCPQATVLIGRWLDRRMRENPDLGEYAISFADSPGDEALASLQGIDGAHEHRSLRWIIGSREAMIQVLNALRDSCGDWRTNDTTVSETDWHNIIEAAGNWSGFAFDQFASARNENKARLGYNGLLVSTAPAPRN